jgi:hypothetical protein
MRPDSRAVADRAKQDPTSAKFERQVERIHHLIEADGVEVTWNDKIPDPDNPKQPRQIDVTIRREGRLALVECRIHKSRQGVKWIEELKGRKDSLNADSVIAVSASGFTKGAIAKSKRFGIILRSLYNLSENEITNWGTRTVVEVVFYEFTDAVFIIRLPRSALVGPITLTNDQGGPLQWRGLFEMAMKTLDNNSELDNGHVAFDVEVFGNILVCGVEPTSMSLQAVARRLHQDIALASVVTYADPGEDSAQYAHVSKFDLGSFEVLQTGPGDAAEVAVVADISQIVSPPNSFFHSIFMDFGRGISAKWFQIIGVENAQLGQAPVKIRLALL